MKKLLSFALNLYLPITCFGCGSRVESKGCLCKDCWVGLDFISAARCDLCGYKFYHEGEVSAGLCGVCANGQASFDGIRSVCVYKGVAAKMILALKYRDATRVAELVGAMMLPVYLREFPNIDLVAPVPMHPSALNKRMYNQSFLLAKRIVEGTRQDFPDACHPALMPDFLIKTRVTSKQIGLSRKERLRNLKRSIVVNKKHQGLNLEGKSVLIIDDVVTTCATIEECARVIKASFPGVKVFALSFARTLVGV